MTIERRPTRHGNRTEPETAKPPIEDAARRRIGQNLRLLYCSVLDQPLPDRFRQLLDELSAKTTTTGDDTTDREGSR